MNKHDAHAWKNAAAMLCDATPADELCRNAAIVLRAIQDARKKSCTRSWLHRSISARIPSSVDAGLMSCLRANLVVERQEPNGRFAYVLHKPCGA